jgi:hypothetical protein
MTHCFRFFLLCPVYLFGARPIDTKLSCTFHFTDQETHALTIIHATTMLMKISARTSSLSPSKQSSPRLDCDSTATRLRLDGGSKAPRDVARPPLRGIVMPIRPPRITPAGQPADCDLR